MRPPQNYVGQRVRVVGAYAGQAHRYDGILVGILRGKVVTDGTGNKTVGPALYPDLEQDTARTVRVFIPTPDGMTPERRAEMLRSRGKVAHVCLDGGRANGRPPSGAKNGSGLRPLCRAARSRGCIRCGG